MLGAVGVSGAARDEDEYCALQQAVHEVKIPGLTKYLKVPYKIKQKLAKIYTQHYDYPYEIPERKYYKTIRKINYHNTSK